MRAAGPAAAPAVADGGEVTLPIGEALRGERRRHAAAAGRLRLFAGAVCLALCAGVYRSTGQASWRLYLEPLAIYVVVSGMLYVGRNTRALRDAAWAAALIDVTLILAAQGLALPLAGFPAGLAAFSLGLFALAIVFNAPCLTSGGLSLVALCTVGAQIALMHRAGVSTAAMGAASAVIGLIAWAAHAAVRHMHDLAVNLARTQLAQRLEAIRFREASDARSKIERMLAQERELHGRFRAVVEESAARQKQREELERCRREILEGITRNVPVRDTLGRVVRMVEGQRPDAACAMLWRDEGRLEWLASGSLPADVRDAPGLAAELASACLGSAAIASAAIASLRVPLDPPWSTRRELAARHRFSACWSRAIGTSDGRDLGGLLLLLRDPITPSADDRAVLDLASQLVTLAVERAELAELLVHQADHDALTGLPNRRKLDLELRLALEAARKSLRPLAVAYLDLDRFKGVNDTLGHAMGDQLLVLVAERLREALDPGDAIARMGGDEFAVVFRGASGSQAIERTGKLLRSLAGTFQVEGHELYICGCAGVAAYPDDGQDGSTLLRNADAALYAAKREGPGSIKCFTPTMADVSRETLELENDLRRAIERGELRLVFQEQVRRDGRIDAVEALVRWEHPRLGLLPPVRFIPLAEETGIIVQLGEWVLAESLAMAARWRDAGLPPVRVAVNVSGLQLRQPDFLERTLGACDRARVDPSAIELELTETVLSDDADVVVKLAHLRAAGMGIAIDDFGTGYSSLGYLQRLPIDTVKIDRSFVMQLGSTRTPAALVSAVAAMAHSLGMRIVAEGVETARQLEELHGLGCDLLQGYYFGKPCTAEDIEARVRMAALGLENAA